MSQRHPQQGHVLDPGRAVQRLADRVLRVMLHMPRGAPQLLLQASKLGVSLHTCYFTQRPSTWQCK